ncbi:hypothetical protein ACIPSE_04820 [Streptomyces sp. NPDC090106]|uniref:hypothetical protein n=1 Tax=Streptomyces sp. NPDC090106 TaxID=3365946 RepID=UPI003824B5F8
MTERGLAYDVFGPLWSVLDLGAVAGAESPTAFVAAHRAELDDLLEAVREIGDFSPGTMRLFERQGGWNDRGGGSAEVTPESLTLHSACVERYPPDLTDPAALRRILRTGGDLQLTRLMDGLVGAAVTRGTEADRGAALVSAAVRGAAALLGRDGGRAVADVFRMWRVASLPDALRPDAPTPEAAREGFRAYAHALADALDGPGPG